MECLSLDRIKHVEVSGGSTSHTGEQYSTKMHLWYSMVSRTTFSYATSRAEDGNTMLAWRRQPSLWLYWILCRTAVSVALDFDHRWLQFSRIWWICVSYRYKLPTRERTPTRCDARLTMVHESLFEMSIPYNWRGSALCSCMPDITRGDNPWLCLNKKLVICVLVRSKAESHFSPHL